MKTHLIDGRPIRADFYTIKRPFRFRTRRTLCFGERVIPVNSECKFFEGKNFGFIVWRDPSTNNLHVAKE